MVFVEVIIHLSIGTMSAHNTFHSCICNDCTVSAESLQMDNEKLSRECLCMSLQRDWNYYKTVGP